MRITAITNDLIKMNENNVTDIPKTLYYCGEIINMLLVFDPVNADLSRLLSTDVELPHLTVEDAMLHKDAYFSRQLNHHPVVHKEEDKYPYFDGKTGPETLGTLDGIVAMIMGFWDGTGLINEEDGLDVCEDIIRW